MSLPFKWEFPGGKVESGETYEDTVLREIKEELNIEVKVKRQLQQVVYDYPGFSITLIPFVCDYLAGEIRLTEHKAFLWVKPDELLGLDWAAADVPVVEEYLK